MNECAGADVSHSESFSEKEPSVAAVCGSLDQSVTRFTTHVRLQLHRMEIIEVSELSHNHTPIPSVHV